MKLYRINFSNNRPVSALQLDMMSSKCVELEVRDGRRSIKWVTLFAEDEQEGMNIAGEAFNNIMRFLQRGR